MHSKRRGALNNAPKTARLLLKQAALNEEKTMELTITGRQVEVTAPMRDYVKSKFERISRHFDHLLSAHVILGVEKLDQVAEATLHITNKQLHAEAKGQDAYAAIDSLVDKLDGQIKKHKERLTDHHRGERAPSDA
jgi:putative sigma-54 modulation protein